MKKTLKKKNNQFKQYINNNFKNKTLKNDKNDYSWRSLEKKNCAYINKNSIKNPVKKLKKIALEEAIIWPTQSKDEVFRPILWYDVLAGKLLDKSPSEEDITGSRLDEMNKNNVVYQILSITASGIQNLRLKSPKAQINKSIEVNNYIYKKISYNTDRFKAFCTLPMGSPKEAAKELERCIKKLGMVGAIINGSQTIYNNSKAISLFYDTPEYDILWQKFVDLDVPFYLHPTVYDSPDSINPDLDYSELYKKYPQLAGSPFGFHHNVSQHVLRLMLSGVFDRFPKFKLILGHMGEYLPWLAERFDHRMCVYKQYLSSITEIEFNKQNLKSWTFPKLTLMEYLRRNIYITTSGWFSNNDLNYAIGKIGIDRILFAMDYPYELQKIACDWLDRVPLSISDKEKIAYKNAEKLLKIKITNKDYK